MKLLNQGIICLSLGTAFLAVSCADESPWGGSNATEGKIELNLLTDAYVTMGTRADDTKAMEPEVSKFSVSLVKSDGSFNKTWQTIEAFNKEDGFPQGNYTLSAFYGDKDTEGFEKPYYYGETNVQVELGKTTAQTVTAVLSNALLSVRYSDDLKDMFKSYSASVQTEGHSMVTFAYNEDRPAYLYPGKAKLTVTLSNNNDEKVTLNPADILMTAKHHYVVTIGVKAGETGKQLLDVQITEDIFEEAPIDIVLSDDLFTSAAPTVEAANFTSNEETTVFDTFYKEDSNPEFHIVALGGIKKATLTLTTSGVLPIVGGDSYTFDLVTPDDVVKGQLNDMNIKCFGLFEDSDKMAVVNLKGYERILPEGSYTATLSVTDNNGKTNDSEPENLVVYKIKILGLDYELVEVEPVYYLDNTLTVSVNTHCEELKDNFVFTTKNSKGELVEVTNYTIDSESEADGLYSYTYKMTTDEINDCEWLVKVGYKDRKTSDKSIDVVMPTFKVETDAFAKRVKLRISEVGNTNKSDYLTAEKIIELLRVKKEGADLQESYINKDTKADNIFTITGLNPKNSLVNNQNFDGVYDKFVLYLGNSIVTGKYEGVKVDPFTTEEALDVPNGDFENITQTFNITKINQGGEWGVSPGVYYQNTAAYTIQEPQYWASTNAKTMSGSDNTWFKQPSVFNSNLYYNSHNRGTGSSSLPVNAGDETPNSFKNFGTHSKSVAIVIRNVSWDPSGNTPKAWYQWGAGSSNYYNHDTPTIAKKSVGKMFLGSYNYSSGNETMIEGYVFNSRPSVLTGWFKYIPDNNELNEYGIVKIQLLTDDEKVIAEGESHLSSNSEFVDFSVPLNYNFNSGKCVKLKISVASSYHEEGYDLAVSTYNSRYESYQHGATLVVDDFQFVYE